MKIVLADPPNLGGWRVANHPNLGILYLSAYLKECMPGAEVIYLDQHLPLDVHLERVQELRPDLYAISFATLWAEEAGAAIEGARERFPEMPIIAGGPHPSAAPERVVRMPGLDACAIGEGEATFVDLVRHYLLGEKELADIKGIAWLGEDGEMKITPRRPVFMNLDELPIPDWGLVDLTNYKGNYQYKATPSTAMITSRGCAFDCNFCSNPVWNTSKPWVRMRSPESICEEVKVLYEKGVRDIYIRSDEANVNTEWFIETSNAIRDLGYKDLYFQCNLRADHVTEEAAKAYAESGGWLIYLGIESGNKRTLNGIGKKVSLEGIEYTCEIMKKYGVDVFGLFMMYHVWEEKGELAWESYEDVQGTLNFIRKLRKRGHLDYISFTTTTPMPGSRLWHAAIKHGLVDPNIPIKDLSGLRMEIPGVSVWEMKKSRLQGMLIQLFLVLKSGNTVWNDWQKLRIKARYLLESLIPGKSTFTGPLQNKFETAAGVSEALETPATSTDGTMVARYGKKNFREAPIPLPKGMLEGVRDVLRGDTAS